MLNAFRHHGFAHLPGGHDPDLAQQVLNAFRHHGFAHINGVLASGEYIECSTPSGITASLTRAPDRDRPGDWGVLNAFRHHGFAHNRA